MANPVVDKLSNWQNDADSADTNAPVFSTRLGTGEAGDLGGELRRLKSELRSLSLSMTWEHWLGLKNLAATGNVAFTYVGATQFRVNDNFTASNRNVATVGRRVKACITGSTLYGTISAATFSTPNTTITVVWDSGALDNTLTEIMFGPEIKVLSHGYLPGVGTDDHHAKVHSHSGDGSGAVSHSSLSGLTTGDPHTQYLHNALITTPEAAPSQQVYLPALRR